MDTFWEDKVVHQLAILKYKFKKKCTIEKFESKIIKMLYEMECFAEGQSPIDLIFQCQMTMKEETKKKDC